jgi:hypothetical protein
MQAMEGLNRYGGSVVVVTGSFERWAARLDRYASESSRERAHADFHRGGILMSRRLYKEGLTSIYKAVAQARELGDIEALARFGNMTVSTRWPPNRWQEALDLANLLAPALKEVGSYTGGLIFQPAFNAFLRHGMRDRADEVLRQLEATADRIGDPQLLWTKLSLQGYEANLDGDFEAALQLSERIDAVWH